MDSVELQIGKVGEYLVCADLILKGFIAYPSEQGLPYDVVLDNGNRLLKIQVKTTIQPRMIPYRKSKIKSYIFNVKRKGKKGNKRYTRKDVDIFALVCLDTKNVGYLRNEDMPDTLNIRVDSLKGQYHDEQGVKNAEICKELYKTTTNQSEISRKTGISVSMVNRYIRKDYKPYVTNARYFSDLIRDKDWFYEDTYSTNGKVAVQQTLF